MDPGPDLRVHLVPGRDVRHPNGGTELGRLTAVRGTYGSPVPPGTPIDLRGGVTALIYRHRFSVAFGNAMLTG